MPLLIQEAVLEVDLVLAPELMITEVVNALWRLQRSGQLRADGLQRRLSRAAELVDVIELDRHLQAEALVNGLASGSPMVDCLYLALGRREAAMLLTADRRLQQLAAQVLP
jgi:predicted nucleic acid-binding protein